MLTANYPNATQGKKSCQGPGHHSPGIPLSVGLPKSQAWMQSTYARR